MLKYITVRDYAIAESLEFELNTGMTVITGETGAGKSIMLDALGLCIGNRADSRTIRSGAKRTDITAIFSLDNIPAAQQWLSARDLDIESDNGAEVILRRTVSTEGRSKAFINGTPATLTDCGELGELLIDIHSQHAHQLLLRKVSQRKLLDAYANATTLAQEVADTAQQYQSLIDEFERLGNQSEVDNAQRDLLHYQVSELEKLNLEPGEIERLETRQKLLSNADFLLESSAAAAEACEQKDEEIRHIFALIADDRHDSAIVANIREMLTSAKIQLDEARRELTSYAEQIELDPESLREVNDRLDTIYDLARKHRVMPERLAEYYLTLTKELEDLDNSNDRLKALQPAIKSTKERYLKLATQLSNQRTKAAITLAARVMQILNRLAMQHCHFKISLTPHSTDSPIPRGLEEVEFLIDTNQDGKYSPLAAIASGGELSRISLALQVAATENTTAHTMIFDEVDVGIGGAVAEVVGELLHQLASQVQVICVTHLPQVAAKGDNHLQLSKVKNSNSVRTTLTELSGESRVTEIARMLGGMTITDNTIAHAREMLGEN